MIICIKHPDYDPGKRTIKRDYRGISVPPLDCTACCNIYIAAVTDPERLKELIQRELSSPSSASVDS